MGGGGWTEYPLVGVTDECHPLGFANHGPAHARTDTQVVRPTPAVNMTTIVTTTEASGNITDPRTGELEWAGEPQPTAAPTGGSGITVAVPMGNQVRGLVFL